MTGRKVAEVGLCVTGLGVGVDVSLRTDLFEKHKF
jgi:hypothetical protein